MKGDGSGKCGKNWNLCVTVPGEEVGYERESLCEDK
jgi:hypothetical protein